MSPHVSRPRPSVGDIVTIALALAALIALIAGAIWFGLAGLRFYPRSSVAPPPTRSTSGTQKLAPRHQTPHRLPSRKAAQEASIAHNR